MARRTRAEANWDRILRAAVHKAQGRSGAEGYGGDLAGFAPPSLGQTSNIDDILLVANQIEAEDPNVARILCEHAYSLSQNLDPNSEGRGVLQFKTGLMSVIKQKLAKKEGERIDRSQDISRIQEFYKYYRKKHNVDELQEQERKWRESGSYNIDPNELERRTVKMRKVYATLRVLKEVLDALTREISGADQLVSEELRKVMASDAAKTEEYRAYNILPFDAPGVSDIIIMLPEVRAATSALEYSELPTIPNDFDMPKQRHLDVFDVLQYIFGFQKDNMNNQREHLVLLLANAQSRLGVLSDTDPQLDETAVNKIFERLLDNYNKWCKYIRVTSRCRDATTRKKKLVLVSLYLLIWGEAANVRFLPECICYIFHNMAVELNAILAETVIHQAKSCKGENTCSFLTQVISPVYNAVAVEAGKNSNANAPHSAWRNYDDFNEIFWSKSCFNELQWPWRLDAAFFSPKIQTRIRKWSRPAWSGTHMGKTNFVEHRTFLHLYHSFHRVWMFLVLMFQGLTLIAFSRHLNLFAFKNLLSLGPTFAVMKFFESILDVMLMYGAYRSSRRKAISRIFLRFTWFGGCSGVLSFLYIKLLQERSKNSPQSTYFVIYLWVLGAYAVFQIFITVLMRVPFLRVQANKCDNWDVIQFIKWMHQEHYFVGRGLYERMRDYLSYTLYWLVVLGCKFTFSYFLQIKPLVDPTRTIVGFGDITYTWHDLVSKYNHNALAVASFWAPVAMVYFMDISVWHTIFSAVVGGLIGARERLGEIRSLDMLQKRFESFPDAFVGRLQPSRTRMIRNVSVPDQAFALRAKGNAARFAPFWNEVVKCLREEDYINNREKELLLMPTNKSNIPLVQWPLFLLASKVFLAMDLAAENRDNQQELWERITRDEYMGQAVQEAYHSIAAVLNMALIDDEARKWIGNLLGDVESSIQEGSFLVNFQTKKLAFVVSRITALTGLLIHDETPERAKGLIKAMQDFYDAVTHDILSTELREKYDTWDQLASARNEGRLFSKISWPADQEQRNQIKRLHLLLTIKESAANVPKNLEAQRRLQFFTNSLFMNIPKPQAVRLMMSFSVFTPYYSESVMYSKDDLRKENEDGISTLFYLQKIFPDEWRNFLERIGRTEATLENQLTPGSSELLELRLWASYRGQTLARTVRGMMYYRRALMLQSFVEQADTGDIEEGMLSTNPEGYGVSRGARAQADLKFTYVVTCQIYGQQKQKQDQRAADILFLMQKNEALRIAFIDTVESFKEGKVHREFFSKLVKADINGKDQEIYSIKLPGDPKLGEGKPENQNHAIIFTRGDAIQTIDMNQDNYFEEALKMRNLLEEFSCDHGLRPPSILGVREHVFTGSVSSLAWFMSNQETTFVTLGQRVLSTPLKVRMHYGHPDVFDRLFHITRGGISKASRVINISEDIYAGFNSTLRQGNITMHEYIQVGKGRDVGLNQIALFEAKVSSGNGEQSLSRDVYRLGQLFDFFRMLSFFVTSVGYYVCTMMTTLTVYVFLYGKAYLALSGVGAALENRAEITNNTSLQSALNTQFLVQIGVFTAVPMVMNFILEQGVLKAIVSFITMQLQLCSVFFTFSLGTRTHYFGRTILHGGAKYRATGRGFVVQHIRFAENYRLYSRSHFVKALEVVILLVVYLAYGYDNKSAVSYLLLSFSSWFLAISWLFAPYIFNPSGFEWQKTVDDFDDWTNWLLYKGGVGVKGEESWEAWWAEEYEHIRSLRGRILETILSLRFFIFQYGVVYKLKAAGGSTSLTVYGISWLILLAAVLTFKVFTFSQKASVNFQMLLRLIQGAAFIVIISGLVVIVALTKVTVGDIFATSLALIPTGWGILSIALAWKPILRKSGLWKSVGSIARFYDAMMGIVIFIPIAVLSWFPFVSTFQTRLLYNQAFSRGLEISLILAGNRPNAQV